MGLTMSILCPSRRGSPTATVDPVKGGAQAWLRPQLPAPPPPPPQAPTSPCGPRGHQPLEALLLEDDAAADEKTRQEGQPQADIEAVVLPEPLLPAVRGDIAGHLRAEATDDLAQDFLGGAVEADQGT